MKQTLASIWSMLSIPCTNTALKGFFKEVFTTIQTNNHLDSLTFNNYTGLPFLISNCLYKAMNISQQGNLTKRDFIRGMKHLYSNSYAKRLKLIVSMLIPKDAKFINVEDLKLFLLHFHSRTNKSNSQRLLDQVDLMFKGTSEQITYRDFIELSNTKTSDIALILLFFFHKYFSIDYSSIEYYEKIIKESNEEDNFINRTKTFQKAHNRNSFNHFNKEINILTNEQTISLTNHSPKRHDHSNQYLGRYRKSIEIDFIEPSQFFYDYLSDNYDVQFIASDIMTTLSEKETDSDLEDLLSFEDDLTAIKRNCEKKPRVLISDLMGFDYYSKNKGYSNPSLKEKQGIQSCHDLNNDIFPQETSKQNNRDRLYSFSSKMNQNNLVKQFFDSNTKNNTDIPSSNDNVCYSLECRYSNNDKDVSEYKGRITIIGNCIFLEKANDTGDEYTLFKIMLLNKLYVKDEDKDTEISLISTLKLIVETMTIIANDISSINEIIRIIHTKTNYRELEDEYDIEELLGSGTSGIVKKVKHKKTNKCYAAKMLQINHKSTEYSQVSYNELDTCKLFMKTSSNYMVNFHDYFETVDRIYIIMEYIEGVNLELVIKRNSIEFQKNKRNIMTQLIQGLTTLYSYGIIHRDIKPANIMIINQQQQQNDFQVRLIDFGFSKSICRKETIKECLGTVLYASPEVIRNEDYSINIDIWSLGVIFYYLLYQYHPFLIEGASNEIIIENILRNDIKYPKDDKLSNKECIIGNIIKMCLEKDMSRRTSICEVSKLWGLIVKGY